MLRALTSYFFGGTDDRQSTENLECETKEVKDWLVVNMPDRQTDDIDFEDVDASEAMEDDDILTSLSVLMTSGMESIREDNSSSSYDLELMNAAYSDDETSDSNFCHLLDTGSLCLVTEDRTLETIEKFVPAFDPVSFAKDFIMGGFIVSHNRAARHCKKSNKNCFLLLAANENSAKGKEAREELALKAKKDVTCHPAFTTTFCNHRHLSFPSKTDALERVKELEPEQRAKDQAFKKHITRSQLNRQNKNYIYEKSSKRNRRSNLQRKPSGANNNRKC